MEHIVDTLLEALLLSRANVIYAGGGHAVLLLPNAQRTQEEIKLILETTNEFFLTSFGNSLYFASGQVACCADDLTSHMGTDDAFAQLFRQASTMISQQKVHRYGADALLRLNHPLVQAQGRECAICGISTHLQPHGEEMICDTCARLERFSSSLTKPQALMAVCRDACKEGLSLPQGLWLKAITDMPKDGTLAIRTYAINVADDAWPEAVHLSVGNAQ